MSDATQPLASQLDALPAEELLSRALETVAAQDQTVPLRALATWALAQAARYQEDQRYGVLHMVAGAATARAMQIEAPPADEGSEAGVVAALNDLQQHIDAGQGTEAALTDFAALGAWLLAHASSRYLDMKVRTDPDDTVFFWTSGVMALRQRQA